MSNFKFFCGNKKKLIEHKTHLWSYDPVITELSIYKGLKKREVDLPSIYFAIPWAVLINKNLLDKKISRILKTKTTERAYSVP